ncbi:hypothetical protein M758_1G187900 [Ceratodon purpureus]|nr:hypothetical protein M758_1G187900 [Ceratodon purpureus]
MSRRKCSLRFYLSSVCWWMVLWRFVQGLKRGTPEALDALYKYLNKYSYRKLQSRQDDDTILKPLYPPASGHILLPVFVHWALLGGDSLQQVGALR